MNNPGKQKSINDGDIDGTDRLEQSGDGNGGGVTEDTMEVGASGSLTGMAGRLTDILGGEGDGDLLINGSEEENTVIQWLQALNMQVMGACRADERLKPLLKHNVSTGVAEDRLLNHLSQHFEPSEVGLLARCLCIPLVSTRVGKINKEGTLLLPTSTRGNLNLALLPTSDLRISFIGDDGHVERLCTLSNISDCSTAIEEIPADQSGRSFLIKNRDGKLFYFWSSEKSRLLGKELLEKMKNLLKRKPSLAELTGISESRLENFATHLRAYLVGRNPQASAVVSRKPISKASANIPELSRSAQSGASSSKPQRSRPFTAQGAKSSSFNQGSLSPRPSSFKESLPRNLTTLRTVAREKLKTITSEKVSASSSKSEACAANQSVDESTAQCLLPSISQDSLVKSVETPFFDPSSQVSPLLLSSPYYCWCPPVASALQYTVGLPPLSATSSNPSFSLPPLSSLLSAAPLSSSLLTPKPTLDLSEIPPMDFPPFLPEPLMRLPLSMPTSQQIPTFTPLMCDPIVHIPVMDLCSAGQAYLVSAGPGMSVSPLLPSTHSLIKETDSMVEKSARETLRLLLSGGCSQANQQLVGVLPSVLGSGSEMAGGSRGLYSGTSDVGLFANTIAGISIVSPLSERTAAVMKRGISHGDFVDLQEKEEYGCNEHCLKDNTAFFSDTGEGNAEQNE